MLLSVIVVDWNMRVENQLFNLLRNIRMDSAVLDDDRIVIFALPTYLLRLIVVLHHALVGFICPRDRIIGTSYFCLFFDFIDLSLLLENWILVDAVHDLKVFKSWDFIDVR